MIRNKVLLILINKMFPIILIGLMVQKSLLGVKLLEWLLSLLWILNMENIDLVLKVYL